MSETGKSYGGIGILGLLGIVFVVLKLCKVIDWAWIWVLAPFWIELIISIIVIVAYVIFIRKARKW